MSGKRGRKMRELFKPRLLIAVTAACATSALFFGVARWRPASQDAAAEEFAPGDFEKLYPRLVASESQDDRDRAARLLLFYEDLLLKQRGKYSGEVTLGDVRIAQTLLKEHGQRHPALLTNYAFVIELLKRSIEVEDFPTAEAVFATLKETHPEQLREAFPCLTARSAIDDSEAFAEAIKACDGE
jgi:hypothetical protein